MSSPSEQFQCRWQGSRRLLMAYLASMALALLALWLSEPRWWLLPLAAGCLSHACWVIPRRILLTHPDAITGLRRDSQGWQLYSRSQGWQAVRLLPDSMALPGLVVLRFVRAGRRLSESQCVCPDALALAQHRRLRLRLKFSRRRWAQPS
ncbi:protein YgfX [Pseudomonas plecoglossicida]|uniref:protein YgfX n=1 Tax=Pseudomonas plecoglossicida TaxID=70775 RepID=UPI0015E2D4F2|nr:protein YgfX [Pseudomonas plecoglossicida]MBA1322453.1 hypothetical protein [Pseudomonas plecoglossicida]